MSDQAKPLDLAKEVAGHPRIVPAEGGGYAITLAEPVTLAGEVVTTLKLRRIKGKDMRDSSCSMSTPDGQLNMAARLTGKSPAVFDEMGLEDVQLLQMVLLYFFESSQPTGTKP